MLASSVSVLSMLATTVTITEGYLFLHANFKRCAKGNILVTLYNLSFNKCSWECQARQKCAAANYWRQRKKCEIVDSTDTTPVQLTVVGDSCVSIAISDLPEVDSCRGCEGETSCNATDNQCNRSGCENSSALVTGSNGIGDSQITASAKRLWRLGFGRLNKKIVWANVSSDKQQYIQYEFNDTRVVNEIITQGGPHGNNWVTSFKIYYSADCASFMDYKEIFNGNSDGNSPVSNVIDPVLVAKCVRVAPQTWNERIAMRIELMGCSP